MKLWVFHGLVADQGNFAFIINVNGLDYFKDSKHSYQHCAFETNDFSYLNLGSQPVDLLRFNFINCNIVVNFSSLYPYHSHSSHVLSNQKANFALNSESHSFFNPIPKVFAHPLIFATSYGSIIHLLQVCQKGFPVLIRYWLFPVIYHSYNYRFIHYLAIYDLFRHFFTLVFSMGYY